MIGARLELGNDVEIGAEEACAKLGNLSEQSSCLNRICGGFYLEIRGL